MNARPSTDTPAAARHNPDIRTPRRDTLIDEVSRELRRRHGGNDVLNRLEAEIIVDHYLVERRPDQRRGNAEEIIRSARKAAQRT